VGYVYSSGNKKLEESKQNILKHRLFSTEQIDNSWLERFALKSL